MIIFGLKLQIIPQNKSKKFSFTLEGSYYACVDEKMKCSGKNSGCGI